MHIHLAEYLSPHKEKLAQHYAWKFNEKIPSDHFGFTFSGSTPFERSLELKRQLSEAALSAKQIEKRQDLANYSIKEWGGIRRFSKAREVVEDFGPLAGGPRPAI